MSAAATDLTLSLAVYASLTDTTATVRTMPWSALIARLGQHEEREDKESGRLWAPIRFAPEKPEKRLAENIGELTAAVFDVDHGTPHWGLLEGLEYLAHTTHSHTPDDGRWRVVIQLSKPCPVQDWPEAWRRIRYWFVPEADEAAKDCSRAYFLPSHRPGVEHLVKRGRGVALDWEALEPAPVKPPAAEPPRRDATGAERPGDRYIRETDWADILAPQGWLRTAQLSGGVGRWRCPQSSKRIGHCASAGGGGYDVLYVFCSSAAPFAGRASYTKFRAYSLLEHGGDDQAAARALQVRYQTYAAPPSPGAEQANGHGPTEPTPPTGPDTAQAWPGDPFTDLANARRLVRQHGADLRYCFIWQKWLVYTGKRWELDTTGEVWRRAKRAVLAIYAEASEESDDKRRVAIVNHAKASESARRLASMIQLAQSEPGVPVVPGDLDSDPWLLNVRNGTLDLRTGMLRPHDRRDLLTKLAPVRYDHKATAPTWTRAVEEILPSAELRRFVQRALGYSITGDVSEQVLFIPVGVGANGKSTLLGAVAETLGDYAQQAAPELLTAKRGDGDHPTGLADLFGARFVATIETEEGRRLAESLVKQLTGGDRIKARRMREDFWEFAPTHKVWLATNHKPVIRGTDYAIWRRIRLVPFLQTFTRPDKQLPLKLRAERPGILAWLVRGCLDWQQQGLGLPDEVKDATEAYRSEMDTLGAFISDCCIVNPNVQATAKDLYAKFKAWCEETGEHPMRQIAFGQRLCERGFRVHRGAKGARSWLGIALHDSPDRPFGYATDDGDKEAGDAGDAGDTRNGMNDSDRPSRAVNPESASPVSPTSPDQEEAAADDGDWEVF